MDISGKLFIIAMITYAVLFCGFIITGITLKMFKYKSDEKKQKNNIINQHKPDTYF